MTRAAVRKIQRPLTSQHYRYEKKDGFVFTVVSSF